MSQQHIGGGIERTVVSNAGHLAEASGMNYDEAVNVLHLLRKRQDKRADDRTDIIVELDDWATRDKYGPIANGTLLFVGEITDYSMKAYQIRGGFYIDRGKMQNSTADELDDEWITDLLYKVDETDDGAPKEGMKFLPKKVVKNVIAVE